MASHGFTSGFQPFWQWKTGCTTVPHFRCIWQSRSTHDNNTSPPMTAVIGCLHAPYLLLAVTSGPKRHLVGAKAHWRSPSLLAQALTPCLPVTQANPTLYLPLTLIAFIHCNSCAKQPKISIRLHRALRSWLLGCGLVLRIEEKLWLIAVHLPRSCSLGTV